MFKVKDKFFKYFVGFFIIIAFLMIIPLNNYKENQETLKTLHYEMVEDCKEYNGIYESDNQKEICTRAIASDLSEYRMNAYEGYGNWIYDFLTVFLHEFIIIFVIVLGSCYFVTKYLKNRMVLNDITRENYSKLKRKLFLSSWKYSLLVPLFLSIVLVLVSLFTRGNFTISNDIMQGTIFNNNFILYFIVVMIQSFILTLLYTNIGLIVSRYEHNFILAVIKAYLVVVGVEIFLEAVVNNIMLSVFNSSIGMFFNILNVYNYTYYEDNLLPLFVIFCMLLISFVILHICYKDKEKLIIRSERNDDKDEV